MTDDPYAWTPPDAPRETWSDADWLRDMARANLVTEDIERADKIAARLEQLERAARADELYMFAAPSR